jgi:U6 snRNA-associated Sm-like protein LSm6
MSEGTRHVNEFIADIVGKKVSIKLNSGVEYKGKLLSLFCWLYTDRLGDDFFLGTLACLDGYMNIAMEQTEEFVRNQLTNKYGDAFFRGNNGNFL